MSEKHQGGSDLNEKAGQFYLTFHNSSENGGMGIDFFEEDEVFKKVVKKLLEESDMD